MNIRFNPLETQITYAGANVSTLCPIECGKGGFNCRPSRAYDLIIGMPVDTMLDGLRYEVGTGTGRPGVRVLCLRKVTNLIVRLTSKCGRRSRCPSNPSQSGTEQESGITRCPSRYLTEWHRAGVWDYKVSQ